MLNGENGKWTFSEGWKLLCNTGVLVDWKSPDSDQQKTESGLPNKWDIKPRLHNVPDSPFAGILFSWQLLPKIRTKQGEIHSLSYTPSTVSKIWPVVYLKGRKSQYPNYTSSSSSNPQSWTEMNGAIGWFPNSLLFSQDVCRGISLQAAENEHISKYQRWGKCKYCLWGSTRQQVLGSHQQINHMPALEATSASQIQPCSKLCPGTRTCHWKTVFLTASER